MEATNQARLGTAPLTETYDPEKEQEDHRRDEGDEERSEATEPVGEEEKHESLRYPTRYRGNPKPWDLKSPSLGGGRVRAVKLYVCWTTIQTPRPGGHPCHNAHEALRLAGYEPEVIKVRGLGIGPRFVQWMTDGRREVERLSGQPAVPVLVTDDGEVVADSKRIVEWAETNPAHRAGTTSASASGAASS